MNQESSRRLDLTERAPRIVGREEELERLHKYLHARGEKHFVYYWAPGGLGKTRLLEEVQHMVAEAGPGFYSTGIIDLYHTDTHSTSDVERAIVEGLDPEEKYFPSYRRQRASFELLRERGADPGVLERRREELSQIFVRDCRDMALDARKLVVCFDTVELLQYESSIVEEMAGLDTMDARIKPWLLKNLALLANVLVILAGRPKLPAPGEETNPQARLVADMQAAFGRDLTVVELQPFTFEETQAFIEALADGAEVIPAQYLSVVHCLTGGQPIFLYLVVDLIRRLSPEPRAVLKMFDQYVTLVDTSNGDERLAEARDQIELEILRGVFNEAAELGGYLARIALMPKGVDAEILHHVLGLPQDEAEEVLARLEPLSFTKRFKSLPGVERLHPERLFFHDEMYRLLTKSGVMPNLRLNERTVAHALEMNYYSPRIAELERELREQPDPGKRVPLRERLQKLQVECLYYQLACDPCQGYKRYKRLSDQANRERWVGFSMRLLDEFLRSYNAPERRKLFEMACIARDQVVRESAQMWVERFHWWGQYEPGMRFARQILDQPQTFSIRPEEDVAILGNICALWARARAMAYGYEPQVVAEAQAILDRLPPLADCTPEQALARARLSTSVGFQLDRGGLHAQAAAQYVDAKAAFRKLNDYPDELAMLLNNLAFTYARQGRMDRARPLAHEALRINENMGSDYSTGLTLATLANMACMRQNYQQAVAYGEEALALFQDLGDAHGTVLAYLGIVQARRRLAKHELQKGRKREETRQMLEEASRDLDKALQVAREAGLGSDVRDLLAEQGRVSRELGHAVRHSEGLDKGLAYYRESERQLQQALKEKGGGVVDRADTLEDLAEVLFFSGDGVAARQCLEEVETLIGPEYRIVPGEQQPAAGLPNDHFVPLGKVEMMRGQMAFAREQLEEGLEHYVLAYGYFVRFSPDAVEKETLIEYVYNHLRDVSLERQQEVLASVRTWVDKYRLGTEAGGFLKTLQDLLGV